MPGMFVNFSGVQFTPAGGAAISITEVLAVDSDMQGQTIMQKGDADLFPTHRKRVSSDPRVTIRTNDIVSRNACIGLRGALTWIEQDEDNGATPAGGALRYTLSNAVEETSDNRGQHAAYRESTLTFGSYSTDGTTSPLAVTAV